AFSPTVLNREILAVDQTRFAQALPERRHTIAVGLRGAGTEEPDHRHSRPLRARHERPRCRRAAQERDEVAPTAGTKSLRPQEGSWGLTRIAWKVSHSDTKPLSGGSAEIAAQPTRKTKAVCGMRWISPPRCSMSRSPVLVSTEPAPKNRRLLNTEWLNTCSRPAVSASAAAHAMPYALKASARPSSMKMIPMFSTLWYESRRLRSCCISA